MQPIYTVETENPLANPIYLHVLKLTVKFVELKVNFRGLDNVPNLLVLFR